MILNFGGRGRDGAGLTAPLQHVTTEVAAPPAEFVQGLYDETKFLLETVGLFLQRPRNAELEARKMVNEKILRDPQKFGTTTLARVAALVPKGRAASGAKKKMLLQSATECRLTSLAVGEHLLILFKTPNSQTWTGQCPRLQNIECSVPRRHRARGLHGQTSSAPEKSGW